MMQIVGSELGVQQQIFTTLPTMWQHPNPVNFYFILLGEGGVAEHVHSNLQLVYND